jgi:hypothetical protein
VQTSSSVCYTLVHRQALLALCRCFDHAFTKIQSTAPKTQIKTIEIKKKTTKKESTAPTTKIKTKRKVQLKNTSPSVGYALVPRHALLAFL